MMSKYATNVYLVSYMAALKQKRTGINPMKLQCNSDIRDFDIDTIKEFLTNISLHPSTHQFYVHNKSLLMRNIL